MSVNLNIQLHPGQLRAFQDPARFKVVAAGRRWGKTHKACVFVITEALKTETTVNGRKVDLTPFEVWYVAPTYDMAKDIFWGLLKSMAGELITKTWENEGKALFANGRTIQIKGSDRPDRLRGVGLSALVMDEYADMKPQTWTEILRPTLADISGKALFIGTPKRKNHFYDLYLQALNDPEWACFHFESQTNPYLPKGEVDAARRSMPREVFRQEFEASFDTGGGIVFDYPLIEVDEPLPGGDVYIACDLAGFGTEAEFKKQTYKLVETAFAVVSVHREGWYVLDVEHGRWDVRETSVRLLRLAQKHKPLVVGIEKGISRNAILPYLNDQMSRIGVHLNLSELSHGGQAKSSRIAWALQGRLEHGRIFFTRGEYLSLMREQLHDFPNGRHDDMVDALSYIDQIAKTLYLDDVIVDDWAPLDRAVGL